MRASLRGTDRVAIGVGRVAIAPTDRTRNRLASQRAVLGVLTLLGLLAVGTGAEASLMVPVQASVQGFAGSQTIGNIVADGGFTGPNSKVGSGLRADFTFANNFGTLDSRYDFDWVSVMTKQDFTLKAVGGNGPSALFPNPPNIDPIPQEDDKLPFYYNKAEWFDDNKFAGLQIHSDGQFSRFLDIPNQPADRTFHFLTFLVVRDNGAYTLGGETKFCVLAGFSWDYQGADATNDRNRGTSTPIGSLAISQDVIDILNMAINSEGKRLAEVNISSDKFTGWSAIRDCVLVVPEPASVVMLGTGLIGLLGYGGYRHERQRSLTSAGEWHG